jgi:hypothetical protein
MLQVPIMPISHLVNRFNGYDACTELALFDAFSQLTLGLTQGRTMDRPPSSLRHPSAPAAGVM